MKTQWTVLPAIIGKRETFEDHTLPKAIPLDKLRKLVEPHLDGDRLEHVSVLWEGAHLDMFVGETSVINNGIRNVKATEVYRNNWMTRYPDTDPESLPPICGPAVLFHRRVWF